MYRLAREKKITGLPPNVDFNRLFTSFNFTEFLHTSTVADRFANTDHTYIFGGTYFVHSRISKYVNYVRALSLIEQSWRYLESGRDSNFLPYSLCLKTPSKAMNRLLI